MSLTKFNESVTNHQSLPDKPTLSSAELKTLWDKAGVDIKNYLNQILTEEIDSKISEFQTNIKNNASAINNNTSLINENTTSINNMLNRVYPIGSIYMSVNNTNPSTLFGGTWIAWGAGKVPVGVNANETEFNLVEKTGGAKTHTLTTQQIPSHGHSVSISSSGSCTTGGGGNHTHPMVALGTASRGTQLYVFGPGKGSTYLDSAPDHTHTVPNHTHTVNQSNTGGGQAHNNLQPYITCYMWKRTA